MGWLQRIANRADKSGGDALHRDAGTTPPGILPPPRSHSDTGVLGLSAVYRAVSIIAGAVCQLSIDTYRGDDQIQAPAWVRRPDIKTSRSAWLEQTTVSLAVHGNAYWRVIRDAPGDAPQALIALDPSEVTVEEVTGRFSWRSLTLEPWQCQHLQLLRIPGRTYGLGPIQAARADLNGAMDVRDYGAQFLTAAGVPSGVLTSDQVLTPDQAAGYKTQWNERANRADGVAVLGSGLRYTPLPLSPKDAQFIESRQYSTTEIARLFGIPAHLILAVIEGTSTTYANMLEANTAFVQWTLTQYLREIEEAISTLLPRGQQARFNLDALLRASTKTRYEAHAIALGAGFLTIDEVRAIEGLAPLDQPQEAPID